MSNIILPGRGRCRREKKPHLLESACCALIFLRSSWRLIIRNEQVACILIYKLPVSLASLLRIALNISDCSSLAKSHSQSGDGEGEKVNQLHKLTLEINRVV